MRLGLMVHLFSLCLDVTMHTILKKKNVTQLCDGEKLISTLER